MEPIAVTQASITLAGQIMEGLARQGYLISQQRRILIAALCAAGSVDDVEAFWMQLRQQYGISWATVYTNLNLLARHGWLIRSGRGPRSYTYTVIQ
ncbi:pentatricopeptide repeat domain-containing protein (PPR motif) [bacterium A37T11]|nr:pentatricopeptide repeat domain-containing protein (PPR motif) [bacterium A37T11]